MTTAALTRREFLTATTVALTAAALAPQTAAAAATERPALPEPSAAKLPRWRGFNLLEMFNADGSKPYVETDFEWLAELGFNFVRLPMSYRCWVEQDDWLKFKEPMLQRVDLAVEYGRKHGVHVNLNLHRAPGYCVNPPAEPLDLFADEPALDACAQHWALFAKRFKGVPNRQLSFDLLNEPKDLPEEKYTRIVRRLIEAIRAEDSQRLIIADGLKWGTVPVPALASLGIAQSTRGYAPFQLTHYRASWAAGSDKFPLPTWPTKSGDTITFDKERLRRENIEPWQKLAAQGVGVHVGEWGAYRYTPHAATLVWMRDNLDLWQSVGWGWALWNFRGDFGVLDSRRTDVTYEDWRGHKLDRQMLETLQKG
jgi:endoglucanase